MVDQQSELQMVIGQSIIPLGVKLIVLEIIFSLLVLIVSTFFSGPTENFELSYMALMIQSILFFIMTIVKMWVLMTVVLEWAGKKYIIRKEDLTLQDGVFSQRKEVINSSHIETIDLSQNFFERMLNLGTIELYSPMLDKRIYLRNITKPRQVIRHIREAFNSKGSEKMVMMAD